MIYLVRSYTKEGSILKIGYTEDSNKEKRISQYKLHNPGCEFLGWIDGCTRKDERNLHYKFKEYKIDLFNEWFEDREEIVDYFNSVTLEEIKSLPINSDIVEKNNKSLLKSWRVVKLLDYVLRLEGREDITTEDFKDMLSVVNIDSTVDSIFEDLQSSRHYPSILPKTWSEVEGELFPSLGSEIDEFFSRYDQLTTYVDKIHMIVDFLLSNPNLKTPILNNLADSDKIKQQLVTVGPERIKSLSYNLTRINKDMGITIFDRTSFMEEIYSTFTVGGRYSKKYIKEKLGDIYSSADFHGTPKASDIKQWFEIRSILLTDIDTKKRINGFEIVSKK